MIKICGSKTNIKMDRELGKHYCNNCEYNEEMFLAREIYFFHILKTPIFKKITRRVVLCGNCGVIEELDEEEYNRRV